MFLGAYLSILGPGACLQMFINIPMMSCHQGAEDTRSADMLPSTIQGGGPEKQRCSPEIGNDEFEEMVCTFKLVQFLLP